MKRTSYATDTEHRKRRRHSTLFTVSPAKAHELSVRQHWLGTAVHSTVVSNLGSASGFTVLGGLRKMTAQ